MEEFINKWQTLIGSACGSFIAIIFAAIGFIIKSIIKSSGEKRESLRRIEISTCRSLEDVSKVTIKLCYFVSRLRDLIGAIEANQLTFSLETIDYPTMRDIYRDDDVPNLKIMSYYLHNKLLWIDAGIKETNASLIDFRNKFAELKKNNELCVILMGQNLVPSEEKQRREYYQKQRWEYCADLKSFADCTDAFNKFIKEGMQIMFQVRVYNNHLREKFGNWFLWKHEGTRLKYFRNKKQQKDFSRNLESLERIDKEIGKEVGQEIQKYEQEMKRHEL